MTQAPNLKIIKVPSNKEESEKVNGLLRTRVSIPDLPFMKNSTIPRPITMFCKDHKGVIFTIRHFANMHTALRKATDIMHVNSKKGYKIMIRHKEIGLVATVLAESEFTFVTRIRHNAVKKYTKPKE